MKSLNVHPSFATGKAIHVGIDVHKATWSFTVLCEGEVMMRGRIMKPTPAMLVARLSTLHASSVHTVYEAGPTGFWLHDALEAEGYDSQVVAPSEVASGTNRVKTDKRDAEKLACLLANRQVRGIAIPTPMERADRQLTRTRQQIQDERTDKMRQIKGMLLLYGMTPPEGVNEHWSREHVEWIRSILWPLASLAIAMNHLLDVYSFLTEQLAKVTKDLKALAETERHAPRIAIIASIPGVGTLTGIQIDCEMRNVERFSSGDRLSSSFGLTPLEHSSGQTIYRGSITKCGNSRMRYLLVLAARLWVRSDPAARAIFERIARRRGWRIAIVAMARRLGLVIRRMLMDQMPYDPTRLGGPAPRLTALRVN